MRIAVVHDYFTQLGGAERVAEAIFQMFNRATLFAVVSTPRGLPPKLRDVPVCTSWMQRLPSLNTAFRYYFPFYPLGVSDLDLSDFDLVISSSSGYAKGVRAAPNAIHICYCHTPMRWVWRYQDYARREQFSPLQNLVIPPLVQGLKRWDRRASRQPDQYIANSYTVAERILEAYGRHAIVVPPPVDIDRFHFSNVQNDHYLVVSRLVSYKRLDLAVEACNRLGRNLMIIGDGPDRDRLTRMAGPTITFLGRQPDSVVEEHIASCRALLFPGEEDFGIVPLEANAAGKPVIAYRAGGALDTVDPGVTGVFFAEPTAASLAEAIEASEYQTWDKYRLRRHAERFSMGVFHSRMLNLLSHFYPLDALRPELNSSILESEVGVEA